MGSLRELVLSEVEGNPGRATPFSCDTSASTGFLFGVLRRALEVLRTKRHERGGAALSSQFLFPDWVQ
jgi:hypothetical protein